jgi:hypothetical protein
MESQIPKGMVGYHGQCRLDHLRREWATASPERQQQIEAEAKVIKNHLPAAHGVTKDQP